MRWFMYLGFVRQRGAVCGPCEKGSTRWAQPKVPPDDM